MTESMLMKVMMDMAETLMVMMLARMIVMKVMMIMVEILMMIILAGDDCDQCLNHGMAADDRVGREGVWQADAETKTINFVSQPPSPASLAAVYYIVVPSLADTVVQCLPSLVVYTA